MKGTNVDTFLTRLNEVSDKAKEHGASLTIALVVPGEIQENLVYQLRKLTESEDPLEGLDVIDVYIDTPEFEMSKMRGLHMIAEADERQALDDELRNMTFTVNAVDMMWIMNGAAIGADRTKLVMERVLSAEDRDTIATKVASVQLSQLEHVLKEEKLAKEFADLMTGEPDGAS